jgi:hypothetical protein
MKTLKGYGNFINESNDEEVGQVLLSIDGQSPSTWYYVSDAITNGLLDEYLDLTGDVVDELSDELYGQMIFIEDIADMIQEDFQTELDKLFDYLLEHDMISHRPTISISGFEEDDYQEVELYYDPD